MIDWSEIQHFGPAEFVQPDRMQPSLVSKLDLARDDAGVPIQITSSYRHGDDKAHGRGWAVDLSDNLVGDACASHWRFRVVRALLRQGFARIGVYDRHIHVDLDPDLPQQVLWWGTSK